MHLRRDDAERRPADMTLMLGAASLAALVAARFVPFHLFPSVCGFRNATGLPCPSCGMTRAFVRVMHGDWPAALTVNPYGTALAFVAMGFVVWVTLRLSVFKRGLVLDLRARERRGLVLVAGALLMANWVYLLVTGVATS